MPTEDRNWIYDQISPKDAEIAARCAEDMPISAIGEDLGIVRSAVDDHIRRMYGLLGGESWRDVARWWRAEKDAYVARLLERFLMDDAG